MTTSVNLILICDRSGSLVGEWMAALNSGIRAALPRAQHICDDTWVRALAFADAAAWHVEKPVKCGACQWTDLEAGGDSDLGGALQLLAGAAPLPNGSADGAATVLVLITDGWPTSEYTAPLRAVEERMAGQSVVRAVVPVGPDIDRQTLREFLDDAQAKLVATTTPAQLQARIGLVVEDAVRAAMKPVTPLRVAAPVAAPAADVPPPPPPPPAAAPVAPPPPVPAATPASAPLPLPPPLPSPTGRVVVTAGDEANALALGMYMFRPGLGAAVLVDTGAALPSGAALRLSGRTRCHCGVEAPLSLVFRGKRETQDLRCGGCGLSTSLKLSARTPPGVRGAFITLEWFDAAQPCQLQIDSVEPLDPGSAE